jgi:hypothetical protein
LAPDVALVGSEKPAPGDTHRSQGFSGQALSPATHLTHLGLIDEIVRQRHAEYFQRASERVSSALGMSPSHLAV